MAIYTRIYGKFDSFCGLNSKVIEILKLQKFKVGTNNIHL